jgi:hypothetical protein
VSFDNSRFTFNPFNDYAGVVMEQGRVQTDADWNEQLSESMRLEQATTLDTLGQAVVPATTPFAFQIAPSTAPNGSITIGRGRMYVDGILVENHGNPKHAAWDPALGEMSGSPQPPPSADANPVAFESQPYYPGAAFPQTAGDYLVYLDVWRQPVTFIEDSSLIDPAINVDTTGRLRTQWRVMTAPVASGTTCGEPLSPWPVSAGQLSTTTITSGPSGPCCLTAGTGYSGVENQFYRVEIHNPGNAGGVGATFKWSRENASVQTSISAIGTGNTSAGVLSTQLTVASLGRDQVLGFSAGDWVEILTDANDNLSQPGYLCKIDRVDPSTGSIILTVTAPSTVTLGSAYTRLVRWDQKSKIYDSDNNLYCDLDKLASGTSEDNGFYGIPVPTDGTSLQLESGIVVTFGISSPSGSFLPLDYWNIAARTANQSIDVLSSAAPRGQHHHFAALSIATVNASGTVTNASDCRGPWPNAGEGCSCCCTYTVGADGDYPTITAALAALPAAGGEICLLPGDLYENVILSGKHNVLIHGCGWQTHVFSASLASNAGQSSASTSGSGTQTTPSTPAPESGLAAVFTILDSTNIELRSFSISAAKGEVGVLLDRAATADEQPTANSSGFTDEHISRKPGKGDTGVVLDELILDASTMPAIVAVSVRQLEITACQIDMHDVRSLWASVYLSGDDLLFARNQVAVVKATPFTERSSQIDLQPNASEEATLPASSKMLKVDVKKKPKTSSSKSARLEALALEILSDMAKHAPGGIQIAGPSTNVLVVENQISGGARNGITLGNFLLLDRNGKDTGKLSGVMWELETECTRTSTTQIPGTTGSGDSLETFAAGGLLRNIRIERNAITSMGMAGIGVAAFWDLTKLYEVISIENLFIVENTISLCMQREMNALTSFLGFAYGAISLADVSNLEIRDNQITDFGETPAADTCGIFLLHGEMVEISRNQIRETRDWKKASRLATKIDNNLRAGILVALVTPPSLTSSSFTDPTFEDTTSTSDEKDRYEIIAGTGSRIASRAVYEPGLPALRIQENVVRTAVGLALQAPLVYGPVSIVDNHFSSGGAVRVHSPRKYADFRSALSDTEAFTDPLLINVVNKGLAIEDSATIEAFAKAFAAREESSLGTTRGLAAASSGAILFANNTCQLEARVSGVSGYCSTLLLSHDGVLATGNQFWVDGPASTLVYDAAFMGVLSAQVTSNRFQEARPHAAITSALTRAHANITTQNIATFCIKAEGNIVHDEPNIILFPNLCRKKREKDLAVASRDVTTAPAQAAAADSTSSPQTSQSVEKAAPEKDSKLEQKTPPSTASPAASPQSPQPAEAAPQASVDEKADPSNNPQVY